VGRLRSALPHLAGHVLDRADHDLEALPPLTELTGRQLLSIIHRSRVALHSVHAHEILMGMLTETGANRMTGASLALRILVEARRDGIADEDIVLRSPAVLALTAPRIGPTVALPPDPTAVDLTSDPTSGNEDGLLREALRLRVRWFQELSGRAAWELGQRLAAGGALAAPDAVRQLTVDDLDAVVTKRACVIDDAVARRLADPREGIGERLPAHFQLTERGLPVPVKLESEAGGGTGAGGGVSSGPVTWDAVDPPPGSILVTTTLTPGLGPVLGRVAGLVSETGSVLSHLAILAREAGVATVVGYPGARDALPEGTLITVDGVSGRVTVERMPHLDQPSEASP
jgi:pyruvate,water dikinase